VVGDFGQASRPGAAHDWDDVLAQLPARAASQVVTLTINYRTPAEIMDVAHRVLAAGAPGVEPTRAVRRTGEPPRFEAVPSGELVAAAAARTAAEARPGTVAVIAPHDLHDALVAELGWRLARAGFLVATGGGPDYATDVEPLLAAMETTLGAHASTLDALRSSIPAAAQPLYADLADAVPSSVWSISYSAGPTREAPTFPAFPPLTSRTARTPSSRRKVPVPRSCLCR